MLHYEDDIIFIDGGSHNADKMLVHWRKNGIELFRPPQYCFEPNPRYAPGYEGLNTTFVPKAMWIHDGTIPLYISRDRGSYGSSVYPNKLTKVKDQLIPYMRAESIVVECIDFSQWLLDNIPQQARIVLKLDIEGAEYEVLKKMMEDGSINLLDTLYAEFHSAKIGMSRKEHRRITEEVRSTGIKFKRWV